MRTLVVMSPCSIRAATTLAPFVKRTTYAIGQTQEVERRRLRFVGMCVTEHFHYIVTELADCGSLQDAVFGTVTPARAGVLAFATHAGTLVDLMRQCASALAYLHDKVRVRHGDLALRNVLLRDSCRTALLGDFGSARSLDDDGDARARGKLALDCAAPELLFGGEHAVRAPADVYSFGVLLFELVAGRRAYGDKVVDISVRRAAPCLVVSGDELLDAELLQLTRKCVAPNPASRPTAAGVLAALLERQKTLAVGECVDGARLCHEALVRADAELSGALAGQTRWAAAADVHSACSAYAELRNDELGGRFVDRFVAIVGGQEALLETAVAREWAEHARVITLEAATRSVARHVHCVRGAELAFFHSVFRRFVLRRDQDPLNDIERVTVDEFETALGDERRRHFERWAQRALEVFLPLDRAFALFGARGMDDTHWFSEQHAACLLADDAPVAFEAVREAFRRSRSGRVQNGRQNKSFAWLVSWFTAATERAPICTLLEPVFWCAVDDGRRCQLCRWSDDGQLLEPWIDNVGEQVFRDDLLV
jgi:hypothetical protein